MRLHTVAKAPPAEDRAMNHETHIHLTVITPHPKTKGERFSEFCEDLGDRIADGISYKVAREKAKGNPNYANVNDYQSYRAALVADEQDRRKRLGFWKYYFGG